MLQWIKERWDAFHEAAGINRYFLGGIISFCIARLDWLYQQYLIHFSKTVSVTDTETIFDFPSWILGVTLALTFVCYWLLDYMVKLRQILRPRFKIAFPESMGVVAASESIPICLPGGDWIMSSPVPAMYVRIQIEVLSETTIKECVAAITGLEKKLEGKNTFERIKIPQTLYLTKEPFNVHPNMPHMVDFLRCEKSENKLTTPIDIHWPLILGNVFDDKATYRFEFSANGEGITHKKWVDILWNGNWDQITGKEIDSPE